MSVKRFANRQFDMSEASDIRHPLAQASVSLCLCLTASSVTSDLETHGGQIYKPHDWVELKEGEELLALPAGPTQVA